MTSMSDIIVVFLLLGLVIVHAYNTGNGNANQRKHESMYGIQYNFFKNLVKTHIILKFPNVQF